MNAPNTTPNANTTTPAPAAATGSPVAVVTRDMIREDLPNHAEYKTRGEKLHLFLKQVGVNTILNMAIGFATEWSTEFGNGKNFMAQGVYNVDKWLKKTFTNPEVLGPLKILWLTTGGNVLVPVIKVMDDNKLSQVKALDTMLDAFGSAPTADEKAVREEAYARIAKEDHPTWGRMVAARVSGLVWNLGCNALIAKLDWRLTGAPPIKTQEDKNNYARTYGYARPGDAYVKWNKNRRENAGLPAMGEFNEWFARTLPIEMISTLNTVIAFAVKYEVFDKRAEKKNKAALVAAENGAAQLVEAVISNASPTAAALAMEAAESAARDGGRVAQASEIPQRIAPRAASFREQATAEKEQFAHATIER